MRYHIYKIFGLAILLIISANGLAQKTDKVFLKNGDVITGEIKSMKFAKLSFDMTGPGTIQIQWEEIVKIKSDKTFRLNLRKGEVLLASLDSAFFENYHNWGEDIVEIVQIKDKFIKRLEGNIDLGFNYSKSNDNFQFNLNSAVTYRRPKSESTFKLNSVLTHNASDTVVSKKQDASLSFLRNLKNSYFINTLLGWQQNTQLGLQNRFLFNGGGGKFFINDNQHRLLTGAGLSYNKEQSADSVGYNNNLDAVFVIHFKKFHYSTPKISLDVTYTIYPGISYWGRVRMEFQLNTKIEIFKDFYAGLNFYDFYDNRPPSGAASKNDFGINFTIGYEFGK